MSARTILKHLHQQGRMTDYQFDVINRNLKERPTGEWLITGKDLKREHPNSSRWYYCSYCGKVNDFNQKTNYCPYCGAKMMKEGENNES